MISVHNDRSSFGRPRRRASSRRRGSRRGGRPGRRGRAGSTGPEANSGIEAGDIDVVLTVANCEAEEGGRSLNHFVGAIIQRRESRPDRQKRTPPPKAPEEDVLCKRGARSHGPEEAEQRGPLEGAACQGTQTAEALV